MNKKIMAIALASVAAGALVGVTAYGQTIRNAAIVTDVKVPTRADNFRLTDQHSKAHELYYFKNSAAVVIITQANGAQYVKARRGQHGQHAVDIGVGKTGSHRNAVTVSAGIPEHIHRVTVGPMRR